MFAISLCILAWKELFCDLILLGKIVMFPFFAFVTISLFLVGIVELVSVDIGVILFILFSKDKDWGSLWDLLTH